VKARTVRLDADLDPVVLGARSGTLWARPGLALAGVGESLRIPLDRPAGGAVAQAALAAVDGPDELDVPGSGAVAFASLPFTPNAPGELVVPELLLGRGPDGRRWLTIVDDGSLAVDDAVERLRAVIDRPVPDGGEPSSITIDSVIDPAVWRDVIIGTVRDRIRAGELVKAVLARELRVSADRPFDPARVVDRLVERFPAAIVFSLAGFVGASPELLVARSGDVVGAHPLAGTAPRSSDPAADQALAAGLLASTKDRSEHQITIDWLLDNLLPFCSYVDAEPRPTIVSLANVHHLGTRVEGRLSSPPTSILDLVAALHPTPAVGGDPQATALDLIGEIESADRGCYAGPTGWIDADGNGAFAVAIRSARIDGRTASCFAGVGVVADSDPRSELAETRSKFEAILGALVDV